MWCHRSARPGHVRDGNEKAHLLAALLHQGVAFELGGPQLRLEIHQPALDFNQDNVSAELEDHISRATVRRRPNGDLELNSPV